MYKNVNLDYKCMYKSNKLIQYFSTLNYLKKEKRKGIYFQIMFAAGAGSLFNYIYPFF